MRSPPSSSSVFLPVNGQVSAKRSPPLSLVKMTIVFSVSPLACERLQHAADLLVHRLDHPLIGCSGCRHPGEKGLRVPQRQALGFGLVTGGLPRPVRRVEVEAHQERLAGFRVAVHHLDRAAAEQVGEIARLAEPERRHPTGRPCRPDSHASSNPALRRGSRRNDRSRSSAGRTSAALPGAICRPG